MNQEGRYSELVSGRSLLCTLQWALMTGTNLKGKKMARMQEAGTLVWFYALKPQTGFSGAGPTTRLPASIVSMNSNGRCVLNVTDTTGAQRIVKNVALVRPGESYPSGADYSITQADAALA